MDSLTTDAFMTKRTIIVVKISSAITAGKCQASSRAAIDSVHKARTAKMKNGCTDTSVIQKNIHTKHRENISVKSHL
jgi:hypothetical protein